MPELYTHKIRLQWFYAYKSKYFSSTRESEEVGFSVSRPCDRNQPLDGRDAQERTLAHHLDAMNWLYVENALRKVGNNWMHAQVPGDGPIRGVEVKDGEVYATRSSEQGEPVTWKAVGQKWVKTTNA